MPKTDGRKYFLIDADTANWRYQAVITLRYCNDDTTKPIYEVDLFETFCHMKTVPVYSLEKAYSQLDSWTQGR